MADFSLASGIGNRKTVPFNFDKEQNLTVKIECNVLDLFDVGGQIVNDALRVVIVAFTDSEKLVEEVLDLSTELNDGQLTLTATTPLSTPSGTSVRISGQCWSVVAKRVEVTVINGSATEPVSGKIDVAKGTPYPSSIPVIFKIVEDIGLPSAFGAGVDLPPYAVSFMANVNKVQDQLAPIQNDLLVIQVGPGSQNISSTLTNTGEVVMIHPNCIALMIKTRAGDTVTDENTSGVVEFNLFK